MLFFTGKQFIEGLGNTKMAMNITLVANVVNIALNYVWIYGKLGFPAMGLIGAGYATLVSRALMAVAFSWFMYKHKHFRKYFCISYR